MKLFFEYFSTFLIAFSYTFLIRNHVYFGIAGTILDYAENTDMYELAGTYLSHDKIGDDYLLDETIIEHILLATEKLCGDPFNACRSGDSTRKYHDTFDGGVWYWYRDDVDGEVKSKIEFSITKYASFIYFLKLFLIKFR